jgi:hypothetical protein
MRQEIRLFQVLRDFQRGREEEREAEERKRRQMMEARWQKEEEAEQVRVLCTGLHASFPCLRVLTVSVPLFLVARDV